MTIRPATLRDASYVMANLRPADWEELACQIAPATKRHEIAYALLMSGDCFVAFWKGQPCAVFGSSIINAACLSIWAVGTPDISRVARSIGKFMTRVHVPDRLAQGFGSGEARSMATHHDAHRWLVSLGAHQHGGPFEFGTGREKFLLFRWTKADFEGITRASSAVQRNSAAVGPAFSELP